MSQHPSWTRTLYGLTFTVLFFTISAWAASHIASTNKPIGFVDTSYEEVVSGYVLTEEEYLKAIRNGPLNSHDEEEAIGGSTLNESSISASSGGLRVAVNGVRNNKGSIIVMVFDNVAAYEEYDYNRAVGFTQIDAKKGTVNVTFDNLNSGPYAIVILHDENQDSELNMKNGIPQEGYGSSGAKTAYDEPSFEQASVNSGKVIIKMFYL